MMRPPCGAVFPSREAACRSDRRTGCGERAVRMSVRFVLTLLLSFVASAGVAQVYRVEHLPAFAPARRYAWDAARQKSDISEQIAVPNGTEVTLVDTLGGYYALVAYDGRTILISRRDLLWAAEANGAGAEDVIGDRFRLPGVGRIPLHSAVGRWLMGYGAAWVVALVLAFVTCFVWIRPIPAEIRIFVLAGGLIAVFALEAAWSLLQGHYVRWLCDFDSLGWARTIGQTVGYFVLLAWQLLLVRLLKESICARAGVAPRDVRLRWVVALPVLELFAAAFLAGKAFPDKGAAQTVMWISGLCILAVEVWLAVRYYRRLGRRWGVLYLSLCAVLLLCIYALVPLSIEAGVVLLAAVVFCLIVWGVLSFVFGSHIEKHGGRYYKVPNLPW